MKTAIVSGALANKPSNGGNAWSRLSWVQGLRQFGFEVWFIEQISGEACIDASGASTSFEASCNLAFFKSVMRQFGLSNTSALICLDQGLIHGMPLRQLTARLRNTSLLFNMGGHLQCPELARCAACRIFFDDDPGYTQFWHATGDLVLQPGDHDFFYTLGRNIGTSECTIPTSNISWRHTRPPVVLKEWPACAPGTPWSKDTRRPGVVCSRSLDSAKPNSALGRCPPGSNRFTTVASWRGAYGPVEFGGRSYGVKAHEFRKFIELPWRSGHPFEIALQIHPADRKDLNSLRANHWQMADPNHVSDSPDAFRHYVQTSAAEFSVAQGVYVDTRSGWFSDRTVRYLASGRPALVQDTGWSRHYPVGEGLLAFGTMDEALEGIAQITRHYVQHCRAARRLAAEFFDATQVVGRLLEDIGIKPP
jgi:hypothetical protein